MPYKLRWYQSEACEAAWRSLCTTAGNPVVVLPTGSGKSLVIAELCRAAVQQFNGRVLVLAHRKELLEQDADKIRSQLPWGLTCGLHSAGLRQAATDDQIIVAGIQSVFRKPEVFGSRQLVIIDEVHLVPRDGEGMYRTFLQGLREINPKLRMFGLTATPFRTGEGSLCRADALFQRICYEVPIQRLIAEGYLCAVTNQMGDRSADTSRLHVRGGEFVPSEVEQLFDDPLQVLPACREIVAKTSGRHSVLVFCSGVRHAEHVADTIQMLSDEECGIVTGESTSLERGANLERFKRRQLRYLCNVDVLTTGFDAPGIDAIAILRATMSPGLFAQICGRGLRTDPIKSDCLVLDFGGNLQRHGPIDAIDYGRESQKAGDGVAPEKVCPACEQRVAVGCRECSCGFKFPEPKTVKHDDQADEHSEVLAKPQRWTVVSAELHRHKKRHAPAGTPDTLRVDYLCEPIGDPSGNLSEEQISEWVCVEHYEGFAKKKAIQWWRSHSLASFPHFSINMAIDLWKRGAVVMPREITTIRDGKFYRILDEILDDLPTEWREKDEVGETWETAETEEAPF
jgi:DNA repair protein RadD